VELPLLTSGEDLTSISRILDSGQTTYSSGDAIRFLLSSQGETQRDPLLAAKVDGQQ